MSWAFLKSLNDNPNQSYAGLLASTRGLLVNKYSQVPQLSVRPPSSRALWWVVLM
jgi:hypothetical protein